MGMYELDDDLVRKFISARDSAGWNGETPGSEIADEIAATLEKQIPLPVPTRIGAVVRAIPGPGTGTTVFVRWSYDNHTHSPWIEAGNHETPYRTDEIGRITAILSEGVDL